MLRYGKEIKKKFFNFRSLEDELINAEVWKRDKEKILSQLNMPLLKHDISNLLEILEISLENKYHVVNTRILKGENTGFKAKYKKNGELIKWNIPYIKTDIDVHNRLFKKLPVSSIGDLMRFVAEETRYIKSFTHIQPRHAKTEPNQEALHAVIVASATGIEPAKMQEISDVEANNFENMQNNFIRKQTLSHASDLIINEMKKLPIFSEYNLADYGVHASVDGQKFGTKYSTIKSRYSKKYFGLLKGVVLYSLNANHLPLCLKVIGANEHESHYLLDIIESNQSDVEIASISGDMHSINRVNFALLHLFGYRFMPRFKQLNNKANNNLVGFQEPKKYARYVIKPSDKADIGLIINEWDNVLRILASLALKQTTQSQVVRKLSVYKKNPTLKALIEFDRIIMSDYILDYIDSKEIREIVQSSLCRGESYHQLTSAIAKISGGKVLNGKDEIDLGINAESIRLIATIVIFYNAQLLCRLYEYFLKKDQQKAKAIAQMSPVAWRHLSFLGKYEFCNKDKNINIQKVIELLLMSAENDIYLENLS
ncbi:Tn3 family transposase [Xenorhabdus budapestensis]|uniref:Tn3 family transposase n=1 Tax=Xenorhabdus budapestensis TaxID=290110 RepID=A0ABX7VKJ1_XENBU|nr:Tn3 family transposase [Xenorhabdus budapestensis]QTL41291.1 Tn3 family transposase [Xenorhabdus budapestensis]